MQYLRVSIKGTKRCFLSNPIKLKKFEVIYSSSRARHRSFIFLAEERR